jgi:hypothetical protein
LYRSLTKINILLILTLSFAFIVWNVGITNNLYLNYILDIDYLLREVGGINISLGKQPKYFSLVNETIKPTFIKGGLFIDYTFLAK